MEDKFIFNICWFFIWFGGLVILEKPYYSMKKNIAIDILWTIAMIIIYKAVV